MGGNLPDDVTPGDIDRAYGGKEEKAEVEVRLGISVSNTEGVDPSEQLMNCAENAVQINDLQVFKSSVEVSEVADGEVRGSVVVAVTFSTVNKHEAEERGLKKVKKNIREDSSWSIQPLDSTLVR